MPWQERCAMDQRRLFVGEYLTGLWTMTELCEQFAISRKDRLQVARPVRHGRAAGARGSVAASAGPPGRDVRSRGAAAARDTCALSALVDGQSGHVVEAPVPADGVAVSDDGV